MIEVLLIGNRWRWFWISAEGRVLIEGDGEHDSDMAAWGAAREWRASFWAMADQIDHRQARAI